ncbi:MAG: acyl carrier protein [Bdellovibrionaceae bacterium]|nr:acyl carrier protein [Bdellovibrionales bacterium]MCB9086156.1 acyl carrier protein [Pseudobdellovibrionaceae bacterium]
MGEDAWTRLKGIIANYCFGSAKEKIEPSSDLVADLGLDSISIVAIVLEVEKAFGVMINGQDFNDSMVTTPKDIMGLIDRKSTGGSAING